MMLSSNGFMVWYPIQPKPGASLIKIAWNNVTRKGMVERPPVAVDGHSWRKYGQKQILEANFPRGYYRCAHRDSQGCLATKQLQQSDNDPAIFLVNYRGIHACSHLEPIMISVEESRDHKSDNHHNQQQEEEIERGRVFEEIDYNKLLKSTKEDLEDIFPSFSFLKSDYFTVSRMNNLEADQSIGDLDFPDMDAYF